VIADFKDGAHVFEETFELAVIVDDNQTAEADMKENGLHEVIGERGGSRGWEIFADNKTSEVTHGGKELGGGTHPTVFLGDTARFPKVDVKNVEGRTNRPRKMEFAVVSSGFEGGVTLTTSAAGRMNVGGHVGPEEALTDLVKGFVSTKVTAGRA